MWNDAKRIADAAQEIERLRKAVRWMKAHGEVAFYDDNVSVQVKSSVGSSATGASEAAGHMAAFACSSLLTLLPAAIRDAEEAIANHKASIRAMIDAPEVST